MKQNYPTHLLVEKFKLGDYWLISRLECWNLIAVWTDVTIVVFYTYQHIPTVNIRIPEEGSVIIIRNYTLQRLFNVINMRNATSIQRMGSVASIIWIILSIHHTADCWILHMGSVTEDNIQMISTHDVSPTDKLHPTRSVTHHIQGIQAAVGIWILWKKKTVGVYNYELL